VLAQPVYDRIGGQYREGRREEPRIAAAILTALGGASPVVNVGAGAGSYEPGDRPVVAVEPSAVMVGQRLPGAAPAVRAHAEALPFGDGTFGAAMAVLTVHHWADRAYLDPRVWLPMSALALIADADRELGMHRLRADLGNGEWRRRWGHLLALDELDLGYRVVVAAPHRQPNRKARHGQDHLRRPDRGSVQGGP
jgi:Methyltransferase domain